MNCNVPELWSEHQNALRFFIQKRVSDTQDVEDIHQEVLLKVYDFCMHKQGVRNVRSWLFQIASNTIADHYRKQSKKTGIQENHEWTEFDKEPTAYDEADAFVLPLLNFLPEKYAVPVKLADIEGKKQQEIASLLNLSLPAVKSRVQRGRQLLMQEIYTCCHIETDANGTLLSFQIKDSCAPLQKLLKTELK
ncbi:MAG: RNA polymerase sigma factor SigZ [Flavobacterium sp.]|nr:RNA polymerase sigma factor SigZ [Flavobacterium sp.]